MDRCVIRPVLLLLTLRLSGVLADPEHDEFWQADRGDTDLVNQAAAQDVAMRHRRPVTCE